MIRPLSFNIQSVNECLFTLSSGQQLKPNKKSEHEKHTILIIIIF